MLKGSSVYSALDNTLGIIPGNHVSYRVYRKGILVRSDVMIATVFGQLPTGSDDYRLWMSEDERTICPDSRSKLSCYMCDLYPKEDYTFELNVV